MSKPNPYAPSDEDMAKKYFDDYELQPHDKKSLKEIRKKIGDNSYKNCDEIEQHQEFMENLINKLKDIIDKEKRAGNVNWELERQMEEIRSMYLELEHMRKHKDK
ncbi:hypothetical protein JXB28_06160 [Candidatus Woesearchaeota archaeon]|nr:hypothetical protein [Candidatus Woesearchaeota archaeon]